MCQTGKLFADEVFVAMKQASFCGLFYARRAVPLPVQFVVRMTEATVSIAASPEAIAQARQLSREMAVRTVFKDISVQVLSPEENAANLLLAGAVDVVVMPLWQTPVRHWSGVVIGGLSPRSDAAYHLAMRAAAEADLGFGLPRNALVWAPTMCARQQLADIRPDIQFIAAGETGAGALQNLHDGIADAALLTSIEAEECTYRTLRLHPYEIVPAPGQGVWAYLCAETYLPMRRALQAVHHSPTAALTNIERTVLLLMEEATPNTLAVYAESDALGNYHIRAAWADEYSGQLRRARFSFSTRYKAAERLVEQLRQA